MQLPFPLTAVLAPALGLGFFLLGVVDVHDLGYAGFMVSGAIVGLGLRFTGAERKRRVVAALSSTTLIILAGVILHSASVWQLRQARIEDMPARFLAGEEVYRAARKAGKKHGAARALRQRAVEAMSPKEQAASAAPARARRLEAARASPRFWLRPDAHALGWMAGALALALFLVGRWSLPLSGERS